MNKLQWRAARLRAASTFHPRSASRGLIRVRHAVSTTLMHHDAPMRGAAPLRAQWFRNPVSGVLECRWTADAGTEPPMRRAVMPLHAVTRMPRRISRAGMRPPSR
jgi:hypothetical protein